jgi:hypothetical protein
MKRLDSIQFDASFDSIKFDSGQVTVINIFALLMLVQGQRLLHYSVHRSMTIKFKFASLTRTVQLKLLVVLR